MDVKKFLDMMADVVAKSLAPFASRVDALEKTQPAKGETGNAGERGMDGQKGEPGEQGPPGNDGSAGADGKDGTPGPRGDPGERGSDGSPGKDGAPGRDGVDGKDGAPGESGADGVRGDAGERGADGLPGKDGPPPRDGVDGKDGDPGMPGEAGKDGERGADGKDGRDGVDGKDGMPGKDGRDGDRGVDGKSLSVDDVLGWLDGNFSKWALGAERRVYELGEKAVAAMPRPKDGADGLRVEDLELVGRTLYLRNAGAEIKSIALPIPMYRGVFDERETYDAHDMVTWGGSVWAATASTKAKPGSDDTWRLAVKKGRDGKDGKEVPVAVAAGGKK